MIVCSCLRTTHPIYSHILLDKLLDKQANARWERQLYTADESVVDVWNLKWYL